MRIHTSQRLTRFPDRWIIQEDIAKDNNMTKARESYPRVKIASEERILLLVGG